MVYIFSTVYTCTALLVATDFTCAATPPSSWKPSPCCPDSRSTLWEFRGRGGWRDSDRWQWGGWRGASGRRSGYQHTWGEKPADYRCFTGPTGFTSHCGGWNILMVPILPTTGSSDVTKVTAHLMKGSLVMSQLTCWRELGGSSLPRCGCPGTAGWWLGSTPGTLCCSLRRYWTERTPVRWAQLISTMIIPHLRQRWGHQVQAGNIWSTFMSKKYGSTRSSVSAASVSCGTRTGPFRYSYTFMDPVTVWISPDRGEKAVYSRSSVVYSVFSLVLITRRRCQPIIWLCINLVNDEHWMNANLETSWATLADG